MRSVGNTPTGCGEKSVMARSPTNRRSVTGMVKKKRSREDQKKDFLGSLGGENIKNEGGETEIKHGKGIKGKCQPTLGFELKWVRRAMKGRIGGRGQGVIQKVVMAENSSQPKGG